MKSSKLLISLTVIVCFIVVSCDSVTPKCDKAGAIVHSLEDVEAKVVYYSEFDSFVINYHVPGTIDSFWTGVVCSNPLSSFAFMDGMTVVFSGDFRDDKGTLKPNSIIAGQEFYYLSINKIEQVEAD